MQQRSATIAGPPASVVSLEVARMRRRQRTRRTGRKLDLSRPLVALWFGTAIFATLLLVGFATTVAMRAPAVGIPAGIAVATLASWSSAGTWLAQRRRRDAA